MPDTIRPRVLLALAALGVGADGVGTHSAAVGTDHLATADLVAGRAVGALEEGRSLLAVGVEVGDVGEHVLRAEQALGVVLVVLGAEIRGSERTACSTADGAAVVQAGGAVQVAGLPASAGVGVARESLLGTVVESVTVEGDAQVAFL